MAMFVAKSIVIQMNDEAFNPKPMPIKKYLTTNINICPIVSNKLVVKFLL